MRANRRLLNKPRTWSLQKKYALANKDFSCLNSACLITSQVMAVVSLPKLGARSPTWVTSWLSSKLLWIRTWGSSIKCTAGRSRSAKSHVKLANSSLFLTIRWSGSTCLLRRPTQIRLTEAKHLHSWNLMNTLSAHISPRSSCGRAICTCLPTTESKGSDHRCYHRANLLIPSSMPPCPRNRWWPWMWYHIRWTQKS